ncbi:hypothetical protein [Flavobacterium frigidarium]|uniref:Uncharacterized protein n=1 Tax=Flavobacterium frigidarium TaxID=99286 RepID=A0ABV4KCL6_9FLAO
MDPIYCLLVFLLILSLVHLALVVKFGLQIPINFIYHHYNRQDFKSNLETDIFRLCFLTIPLFYAPLAIFKGYNSLTSKTFTSDIVVLLLLICLTMYLLYVTKYKIWSDTFRKIEKPKNPQDEFNAKTKNTLDFHERAITDNEKLANSISNDLNKTKKILKSETSDIFKVTIDNQINIENLKNETIQKLNHCKADITYTNKKVNTIYNDLNNTKRTFESQTRDLFKVVTDNQNNILNIKKKIEVKPRESERREETVSKIEKACKLLMKDLEFLPSYNKDEKTIDFKKHDLTKLQAYQTLVVYFKTNYKVPEESTNAIIFSVFNAHFDIKEKELKSNNWQDFKNRLLPDIENNSLYSDLYHYIKK